MSKITASAKGEECLIRIPGICNHDPATVVFCHRWGGGMGAKMPDICGAYGCSACHDEVDRRTKTVNIEQAHLWFYDGMVRTQAILFEKGLVNYQKT